MTECSHEFESTKWEHRFDLSAKYDGIKQCHQPTIKGAEKCQYHAQIDQHDDAEVTTEQAFRSLITESDHVLGAEFHGLTLDTIELGTEGEVVLHNVKFLDGFEIGELISHDNITIAGSLFDRLRVDRIETTNKFDLSGNRYRGDVTIRGADTDAPININGNVFEKSFRLRGTFADRAQFIDSTFNEGLLFNRAQFQGPVQCKRIEVGNDAYIHKCTFQEGLDLTDADPDDRIFFSDSKLSSIKLGIETASATLLLWHHTNINGGRLGQPNDKPLYYDFTRAILGDIQIPSNVPLTRYYFHETEYDGFRYANHRNTFADENWQLHRFEVDNMERFEVEHSDLASSITPPSIPNYSYDKELKDNEETYLLARQAATDWGDNYSASHLYLQERTARKLRHRHALQTADKLNTESTVQNASKYFREVFHQWTTRYGESPLQPILVSIAVIVSSWLFLLYFGRIEVSGQTRSLQTVLTSDGTNYLSYLGDTLHFSIVTFAPIGYNNYAPVGSLTNALVIIESFTGAFLIALFVFTLGRQVAR
ncbi:ion channel [Halorubrum coriense]|uniref:ion channel n=1 Tax=Halorubrum coriense TaxID=64713 RepID=UPI001267E90F|nr:potassium channel family protein [Halorubrum coriense]